MTFTLSAPPAPPSAVVDITLVSERSFSPATLTAASSIVPALFIASTAILDCVAETVPSVEPLLITRLAGVPETVVTVPLPSVVERKSSDKADALIVSALEPTEALIGWICATETAAGGTFRTTQSVPSNSTSDDQLIGI